MQTRIELVQADITTLDVDAILNAANQALAGGGGVDRAIHRAAGPALMAACRALPQLRPGVRCPTGEARLTPGFALRARHVIHTVGPVWQDGHQGEPELLASCYRSALSLAAEHGVDSLAFPTISAGVLGFPLHAACAIAVREAQRWHQARSRPAHLILCAYSDAALAGYRAALH